VDVISARAEIKDGLAVGTSPASRAGLKWADLLIGLVYACLTVFFTWPVARHPFTRIPENLDDPLHLSFILASQARSLLSRPWDFLQAPYFYPAQDSLVYSEQSVATALLSLPAWLTTKNPIFLYNFVLLLSFLLSALTAYLLLREVTGNRAAAFVGGMVYAFVPYRLARFDHLHVLLGFWMPLLLLYLWRFAHTRAWKDALKFGAVLFLQLMTGIHVGAMALITLFVAFAVVLLAVPRARLSLSFWGKGASIVLLAGVAVGVLLWPYARVYRDQPEHRRSIQEIQMFSGGFKALVTAHWRSRLWGPILGAPTEGTFYGEKTLFLGLLPIVLSVLGVVRARTRPLKRSFERFDPWPVIFLMLTLTGWALAVGPRIHVLGLGGKSGVPSLYGLLLKIVPGLDSIRVPGRFILIASLGLAGLSAYGVLFLTRRVPPPNPEPKHVYVRLRERLLRFAPAVVIPLLLVVEFRTKGHETVAVPPIPQAYRWIASQPPAPILSLPTAFFLGDNLAGWSFVAEARYFYYASAHWRPMINGYSSNLPRVYRENITQASTFPSQESVEYLKALGIRYVVVHTHRLEETPWRDLEAQLERLPNPGVAARFGAEIVLDLERMTLPT
jgi:hypothetical protein